MDIKKLEELTAQSEGLKIRKRSLFKDYRSGSKEAADQIIAIDKKLNEIDSITSAMIRQDNEAFDAEVEKYL